MWIPFQMEPGCRGELGDELIVVRAKQQPPQREHESPRGSDHGERKVMMVSLVDISRQHSGVYVTVAMTVQRVFEFTAEVFKVKSLTLNLG